MMHSRSRRFLSTGFCNPFQKSLLRNASIRAACAEAARYLSQQDDHNISTILWDACRVQARPRLDELAQRIETAAEWENLVLPEAQKQILRDIAATGYCLRNLGFCTA